MFYKIVPIVALSILSAYSAAAQVPFKYQQTQIPQVQPKDFIQNPQKIQVVFALDATGSMSGLIQTAKEKIWAIAGSVAQNSQCPTIEIGLLFYRDRGDAFVTKHVALSQDLDKIYAQLMDIEADGGGDSPESVNQALYESVHQFQWSKHPNSYKTIFLVGDCPPHMDYREVKYPQTCIEAQKRGIVVNTLLMGNDRTAAKIWKQIAQYTSGSYTQIGMDANNINTQSPYDEEISKTSEALDQLRYSYGSEAEQNAYEQKKNWSKHIAEKASSASKASRAAYHKTSSGKSSYIGKKELLNDVAENKVDLDKLPSSALPKELQGLSKTALSQELSKKIQLKKKLDQKLDTLLTKRSDYIKKSLEQKDEASVENAFETKIYKSMKEQAAKKNINLAKDTKH